MGRASVVSRIPVCAGLARGYIAFGRWPYGGLREESSGVDKKSQTCLEPFLFCGLDGCEVVVIGGRLGEDLVES